MSFDPRGRRTGSRAWRPGETHLPLDISRTLNAAITRLALTQKQAIFLSKEDLHLQVRCQKPRRLFIFTIDTSDSMGDGPTARISAAMGAIISLAARAYINRDKVCLITFRGQQAEIVVPPTDSVMRIRQQLSSLPVGGATPLADGLHKAHQVIQQEKFKNQLMEPLLVLISDGEATTPIRLGADPEQEALDVANLLRQDKVSALVIETLTGKSQQGLMPRLAKMLGTGCQHIHNLQARQVLQLIEHGQQQ